MREKQRCAIRPYNISEYMYPEKRRLRNRTGKVLAIENTMRIKWKAELELDFYTAMIKCIKEGLTICPGRILRFMPDSGLTREQVSSHLQKYRKKRSPIIANLDLETYKKIEMEINIREDQRAAGLDFDYYLMDKKNRDEAGTVFQEIMSVCDSGYRQIAPKLEHCEVFSGNEGLEILPEQLLFKDESGGYSV